MSGSQDFRKLLDAISLSFSSKLLYFKVHDLDGIRLDIDRFFFSDDCKKEVINEVILLGVCFEDVYQ